MDIEDFGQIPINTIEYTKEDNFYKLHEIFNKKYASSYRYTDVVQSQTDPEFQKIEIVTSILDMFEKVMPEAHKTKFSSYKDFNNFFKDMRHLFGKKYGILCNTKKPVLLAHYRELARQKRIKRNYDMEKFMKLCGSRSRSGVISVTIFTSGELLGENGGKSNNNTIKTGGCPMDCHYCPFEKLEVDGKMVAIQPRSYLSTEPGNMRATQNKHHPVGQVYDRCRQLQNTGHISNNPNETSKIEGIISGATFPFYPEDYLRWFTTCMYYAYNTFYDWEEMRPMKSLEEEKIINEKAALRVIGLTIETRPDYVTPKTKDGSIDFSQLKLFRELGVTRVQIGVQSTKDSILKKVNRKCTNEQNKLGLRRLKQNGFKSDIHIMLDLPGSSPEIDMEVIDEIVDDPDYQADQWKIYPTETTPFTKIREWYMAGEYKPYAEDNSEGTAYKLISVISYAMSRVPEYIRINRVVRDFPHKSIDGGLKYTNARQLVNQKMKENGLICKDIREREIKNKGVDLEDIILNVKHYKSSGGVEYFISFTNNRRDTLYGFIRLRLNLDMSDVMDSIKGCALIRELHVYGAHTCVGKKVKNRAQHIGLGSCLINKAEEIATICGFKNIAVISGVGVRDYYRKQGYIVGEDEYMFKKLPDYFWFMLHRNYLNGIWESFKSILTIMSIIYLSLFIYSAYLHNYRNK